jgi:hypothetical protein
VTRVEGYVPMVDEAALAEVFGELNPRPAPAQLPVEEVHRWLPRAGEPVRGGLGAPGPGQVAMRERWLRLLLPW